MGSINKALRLDDYGVKAAMRHDILLSKKPIARGAFSAIFDGTRKNTVLKMTVDNFGYYMLNDWACGVKHSMFPRVVGNHGEIGTIKSFTDDHPIYLFEMERLEKIQNASLAKRTARSIMNALNRAEKTVPQSMRYGEMRTYMILNAASYDVSLSRMVRNALTQLADFSANMPGGTLDMHIGNFMQRKNGELVITDPIASMGVYREIVRQSF